MSIIPLDVTVRTAVGRSIFPAGGIGRTSKPAAGEGEPADRRARQQQKQNLEVRPYRPA